MSNYFYSPDYQNALELSKVKFDKAIVVKFLQLTQTNKKLFYGEHTRIDIIYEKYRLTFSIFDKVDKSII